jgi:hypothetical protein
LYSICLVCVKGKQYSNRQLKKLCVFEACW